MELGIVLVEGFSFDKFQVADNTLKTLAKMNDFDMPIEMVLVPKTHYAIIAFILFLVSVGNHMSFEV
jgi:hypothetical protein